MSKREIEGGREDDGDKRTVLRVVEGDLLNAKEKYIVHQTNCRSKSGRGLSSAMFKRFPYANCYSNRVGYGLQHATPGTIDIRRGEKNIVNLFGQDGYGKLEWKTNGYKPTKEQTQKMREMWFQKALNALSRVPNLQSVAFPYQIGCGLAGGIWTNYRNYIEHFAKKTGVDVTIYKLPGTAALKTTTTTKRKTTLTQKRTIHSFFTTTATTNKVKKKKRRKEEKKKEDTNVIIIEKDEEKNNVIIID